MEFITNNPIDPAKCYDRIHSRSSGSVLFHYAVVRAKTGDVIIRGIEFEKDGDMEGELKSIALGLKEKWKVEDILIIRRVGKLKVGDIISLIAASAPRREDVFEACMEGIVLLKKMKTVKKKEW